MNAKSALPGTARVKQATRIASRTVGSKEVVVVIDDSRLHTLNLSGTRLWHLCNGRTLDEIVDAFAQQYGLGLDRAQADVRAFVAELVEVGALEIGQG